jgi:hypothetical protein
MPTPQSKPMLAGNPKDSAMASNNQAATRQADLIKATSGGKRRRRNKYGGAADGIVVPQPQLQYTPTGAAGQNPNDVITKNAGVSTQDAENAKYDNYARVGGSRKRKGGNPNWSWGCYSGGRKKSKGRSRTRKSKSYKRKTHKKRRTTRRR